MDWVKKLGRDAHLRALARRWTTAGSGADGDDLMQEGLLRALQSCTSAPDEPRAWMTTVLRHAAIDAQRRAQAQAATYAAHAACAAQQAVIAQPAPAPDEQLASRRVVREALMHVAVRLSAIEAAVLLLHDYFGYEHAEIALQAGRSAAATRQILRRARLRLKSAAAEPARSDGLGFERVYAACCDAVATCAPQPLHALMQPPIRLVAHSTVSSGPSASRPAITQRLAMVAGRWVMRVEQGGVLLCVLPLGAATVACDERATAASCRA